MTITKLELSVNTSTKALICPLETVTVEGEAYSTEIEFTVPTGYTTADWYYQYEKTDGTLFLSSVLTISDGKITVPFTSDMLSTPKRLGISFFAREAGSLPDTIAIYRTLSFDKQIKTLASAVDSEPEVKADFIANANTIMATALQAAEDSAADATEALLQAGLAAGSADDALEQAVLASASAGTASTQAGLAAASAASAVTLVATKLDLAGYVVVENLSESPQDITLEVNKKYDCRNVSFPNFIAPSTTQGTTDIPEINILMQTAPYGALFSENMVWENGKPPVRDSVAVGIPYSITYCITARFVNTAVWMCSYKYYSGDEIETRVDRATKDGAGNIITDTYATKTESGLKVDKVDGKSLIADTEITRLAAITTSSINTQADARITAQKGEVSGIAELDESGLVLASQLPSYVDDVLEYDTLSVFPATGETGKIYLDKSTNLQYRWGGSSYVGCNSMLALGETSATAGRGDHAKTAYDHSQVTSGNPHGVTLDTLIETFTAVSAVADAYTLDLATNINFAIETADAVAKTLAFSNISATAGRAVTISVKLKYTNAATITFPASVIWSSGIVPTFAAGKEYILVFRTYDNGTRVLGYYNGGFAA